jgi:hypothetical protein
VFSVKEGRKEGILDFVIEHNLYKILKFNVSEQGC